MRISLIHISRSALKKLAILPLLSLLYSSGIIHEIPYTPYEGKTGAQTIKGLETPQSPCALRVNSASSFLNFLEFHSKEPSLHTAPSAYVLFQTQQQASILYPKPLSDIFHLRI
ncbi:MAG TPA: hypothetical protein VHO70_06260 [Chitinispirillaceae bacterium]|nr:hypothetical protein [Chitinispirillaceae bacterium]